MGLLDINLSEMLGNFLDLILWNWFLPLWDFLVALVLGFINTVITLVLMIIDILNLGIVVSQYIASFLSLFLEDSLGSIIVAQMSLIALLRVYYFIKGIKVAGFGI